MLNELLPIAIWLKMASKKRYTRERLDGVAASSADKMKACVPNGKLTCEYVQMNTDESIKGSDTLNFTWTIEINGYRDTEDTTTRCNSAVERGVPIPERWKTSLDYLKSREAVGESIKNVTDYWGV